MTPSSAERDSKHAKTRITRRRFIKTTGVAALGLGAAWVVGCGDDDDPGSSETELIIAQASAWSTLDNEFTVSHETQEAMVNMTARLLEYKYVTDEKTGVLRQDVSGTIDAFEPVLAESVDVSPDRQTYTLRLRKGVVSHAGNELTADDVIYSYERRFALAGLGAFLAEVAQDLTSADQLEKVDDYTVRFHLKRPWGTFLHGFYMARTGAVEDSKTMKEHATDNDPWSVDWAKNNPQGFGPYRLESFDQSREAVWVANENFVRGAPAIKRMRWRVVPESSSRLSLIERGDVHVAKQMLAREQETANGEGLQLPGPLSNLAMWLLLPLDKVPLWQDVRMRQAMAHVIPYDDIIRIVYRGRAHRQYGPVWDPIPGAAPEYFEKAYTTDIDEAKRLLAEAGHPDGVEFDLAYSTAQPDQEELAILIRDTAAGAGMSINLKGLTEVQLNEWHNTGSLAANLMKDMAIVPEMLYSIGITQGFIVGWCDKLPGRDCREGIPGVGEFEEAVNRGVATADWLSPEAMQAWNDAQRFLAQYVPMLWFMWIDPPHIFSPNLKGYVHRSDNTLDYSRMSFAG